jgi:hypothetical protein
MKRGPKFKFPDPQDCKAGEPAILCPAERVINLYNQATGKQAKRIAKLVREWFAIQAKAKGWAGVHFLPEIQSNYGAGCVLWPPPRQINVEVTVTNEILVLMAENQ